jgi:hypothetical protein
MWTSSRAVREALRSLGYPIALNNNPVGGRNNPNRFARAFQAHYNQASSAGEFNAKGTLLMDGIAGEHTLNALERVLASPDKSDWAAWSNAAG